MLQNIIIPVLKEKCQLCSKPLDPKASKRALHLKSCYKKRIADKNKEEKMVYESEVEVEEYDQGEEKEKQEEEKSNHPVGSLESMEELMNDLKHTKHKYEEEMEEVKRLKDILSFKNDELKDNMRKEMERNQFLEQLLKELKCRLFAADTELNRQTEEFRAYKDQVDCNDTNENNLRQELKEIMLELTDARKHEREILAKLNDIRNEKNELVEKVAGLKKEIKDDQNTHDKLVKELKETTKQQADAVEIKDAKIAELELKLKDALKSKQEALAACESEKNERRRQKHDLQNINDLNLKQVTIGDKFANGEFGDIFKAKRGNKDKAVKRSKQFEVEALTEAIIMMKLQNVPHVMSAQSILLDPTQIMIEMSMMDGDLNTLIQSRKSDVETEWRRKVMNDTAKGVNHLHKHNIIHCDIKPANFLTKIDKGILQVFISDFGCSNIGLKAIGKVGTPGYIAPEMYISNNYEYDEKVDEWSLGATLFKVLTGEDMVLSDDEEVKPKPRWKRCRVKMQKEIEAVKKLLTVDPKKRATAAEFLKML